MDHVKKKAKSHPFYFFLVVMHMRARLFSSATHYAYASCRFQSLLQNTISFRFYIFIFARDIAKKNSWSIEKKIERVKVPKNKLYECENVIVCVHRNHTHLNS
jgi:hypothetical protein